MSKVDEERQKAVLILVCLVTISHGASHEAVFVSSSDYILIYIMPHCLSICSPFIGKLDRTVYRCKTQYFRHARLFSPTMSINLQVNLAQVHQTTESIYPQSR